MTNPGLDTCTLDLAWSPATAYCGGPATYNVYRSDLSGFEPSPANRIAAGVVGTSYSDASDIQAGATYYYVVRAVDGANGVEDANLEELASSPTGPSSVRFSDSFEGGNLGWTFTFGSPAASTGTFLIGDPVATSGNYGDPSQPGDDHSPSGVNCLYSDENPGGDAGVDDIDNGEVIATSPAFDGSGTAVLEIDLWRWFFNEDNDDAGDYYILDVSNNGGSSWSQVETIPGTVTGTNSWTNVVADLAQIVTPTATMRFRVRSADGQAVGDLVELAIDDIVITGSQMCTPSTLPLPGSFSKTSPANGATGQPSELSSRGARAAAPPATSTASTPAPTAPATGRGPRPASAPAPPSAVSRTPTTYSWQVRADQRPGPTAGQRRHVVDVHHREPAAAGRLRQDRSGQRRHRPAHRSHPELERERRRHQLRVLRRHGRQQRLRQLVDLRRPRHQHPGDRPLPSGPPTSGRSARSTAAAPPTPTAAAGGGSSPPRTCSLTASSPATSRRGRPRCRSRFLPSIEPRAPGNRRPFVGDGDRELVASPLSSF